jgi:molybdate transport system substrate-binding protein
VLAASSLTEVLPQIVPEARYSFGGSNQLAQQIRQGAPFDVYLSASPRHTQALHRERLVRRPVTFASNSLVLIVPRSNPAGIRTVEDLARRPSARLVAAGAEVPAGAYAGEVLERLEIAEVLDRVVSREPDVKGVIGKVALGEADAGFVYATDVGPVGDDVVEIELPPEAQPSIAYEVAIAPRPSNPAAAEAFVASLMSDAGVAELTEAGFRVP